MVAVLIKFRNMHFVRTVIMAVVLTQSYKNSETCHCGHGHSLNKEDCDPIKTQKHVLIKRTAIMITILRKMLFFRTVIMVAVFRNRFFFCANCDHGRNSLYTSCKHVQSGQLFFETITAGHLCLSPLRSTFALNPWAHVVNLKKRGG